MANLHDMHTGELMDELIAAADAARAAEVARQAAEDAMQQSQRREMAAVSALESRLQHNKVYLRKGRAVVWTGMSRVEVREVKGQIQTTDPEAALPPEPCPF